MKTFFIPVILLLIFSSCKKEDKNTCEKTMASIAGTYSFVKFEVGINGVYQDVNNQLESCQLDDKLILSADGKSNYQDLGVICDPNGSEMGNWSITADGKMTINDGSNADVQSAEFSYDCTTLILTEDEPGTGYKYRVTLKK